MYHIDTIAKNAPYVRVDSDMLNSVVYFSDFHKLILTGKGTVVGFSTNERKIVEESDVFINFNIDFEYNYDRNDPKLSSGFVELVHNDKQRHTIEQIIELAKHMILSNQKYVMNFDISGEIQIDQLKKHTTDINDPLVWSIYTKQMEELHFGFGANMNFDFKKFNRNEADWSIDKRVEDIIKKG